MFPKILTSKNDWLSFPFLWKNGQFVLLRLSFLFDTACQQKERHSETCLAEQGFFLELVAYAVKFEHVFLHSKERKQDQTLPMEILSRLSLRSQTDLQVNEATQFHIMDSRVVNCHRTKRWVGIYVVQFSVLGRSYYTILRVELANNGYIVCEKYKIDENKLTANSVEDHWKTVIGDGPLVAFVCGKLVKIFSLERTGVSNETVLDWILLSEGSMEEITSREELSLVPLFVELGLLCCSFGDATTFSLVCCFWSEPRKSFSCMKVTFPCRILKICKGPKSYNKSVLYVLTEMEIFECDFPSLDNAYTCSQAPDVQLIRSIGPLNLSNGLLMTPLSYRQKHYLFVYTSGDVCSYIQVVEMDRPFHIVANHQLSEPEALYVFFAGEIWMFSDQNNNHDSSCMKFYRISHFLTENSEKNVHKDSILNDRNPAKEQFLKSLRQRLEKADWWISQLRGNCANALCCIKSTYYSRVTEGLDNFYDEKPTWTGEFLKGDDCPLWEQIWLKSYLSRKGDSFDERNLSPCCVENMLCYHLDTEVVTDSRFFLCLAVVRNGKSLPCVRFLFRKGVLLEMHVEYSSIMSFEAVDVIVVLSSDSKKQSSDAESRHEVRNDFFRQGLKLENSNILLLHLLKPIFNDSLAVLNNNNNTSVITSLKSCNFTCSIYDYGFTTSNIRKWELCILLDDIFVLCCSLQDTRTLIHHVLAGIPRLLCLKDEDDSSFWFSNHMFGLEIFWQFWKEKHIYLTAYCNCGEVFESIFSKMLASLNCVGPVRVKDVVDETFISFVDSSIKKLNKEWNYIQNVGLSQISPHSWFSIVKKTDEQMVLLNAYIKWKLLSGRFPKYQLNRCEKTSL